MKTLMMLAVSLLVLENANAEISCTPIRNVLNNGMINRGLQVSLPGSDFSDKVWFGSQPDARDTARDACREVVAKTSCREIEPHAQDQFVDVGDIGFGPMKLVKRTSPAGRLVLSSVSPQVRQLLPRGYSSEQGRYFSYHENCEERRAELALSVAEKVLARIESARRTKILRDSDTSVHMWDKL